MCAAGGTAVSSATQAFIVPDPRHIVQDAPWIVIYQRTTAAWETSMVDKKLVTKTDEPNGHYEAVVKQTIVDGETQYQGVFRMDDDTANEYDQVLRVAKNLVAYINQQAASQQMADDFDRKSNIKEYRLLDSVGVRIAGKNPRRGNTPQCLPCLVVDVKVERRVVGFQDHSAPAVYGVVSGRRGEGSCEGGQAGRPVHQQLPSATRAAQSALGAAATGPRGPQLGATDECAAE